MIDSALPQRTLDRRASCIGTDLLVEDVDLPRGNVVVLSGAEGFRQRWWWTAALELPLLAARLGQLDVSALGLPISSECPDGYHHEAKTCGPAIRGASRSIHESESATYPRHVQEPS